MNAKFGEVAHTLHSNCDVWSPKLKKSLMFGLCHLFIVVSMSKLRNPIGEEAGDMAGEENNGDGWGSENVQEEHAGGTFRHGTWVYSLYHYLHIFPHLVSWVPHLVLDVTLSVIANDNVELACAFIQKKAKVEKAIPEIDMQMQKMGRILQAAAIHWAGNK